MPELPAFAELAADPDTTLDLLALAIAVEFRDVDVTAALVELDALSAELSRAAERTSPSPVALTAACAQTLGGAHRFAGDREQYDDPENSMLDLVLRRRRGLPILLSAVYVETARRAGIALDGVGLPGHFVVGHFGTEPPLLLDPFNGGARLETDVSRQWLRPWSAHEIAMRMLNNLVSSYHRRGHVGAAIRAAALRLALPSDSAQRDTLQAELRAIHAQLN